MSNVIIADTSCLIALDKIGHLYILQSLFSTINITTQIKNEFGHSIPDWIIIHKVINLEKIELLLDPDEASATTLALSFKNALVIIDENKWRKVAQELNITIEAQ